ncbi:MAG: transcriptional repressor [Cyanobacteriota bacterium]|jgi:Fur family ferric uptake transcriptional regulator
MAAAADSPHDLPQRQDLLLTELRSADQELSGQDLHARLRGRPESMGLATVYRHLRQLQQRGLVRCRHLPTGEALFAPRDRDDHHLTCVDCGSTVLLEHCPMHEVTLQDDQAAGFQLLFHTLEFFGLCRSCRQHQQGPSEASASRADGLLPTASAPD